MFSMLLILTYELFIDEYIPYKVKNRPLNVVHQTLTDDILRPAVFVNNLYIPRTTTLYT